MTVWIVVGTTESNYEWCMAFNDVPTKEVIEARIMANEYLRDAWEAECLQGWTVNEVEVFEL